MLIIVYFSHHIILDSNFFNDSLFHHTIPDSNFVNNSLFHHTIPDSNFVNNSLFLSLFTPNEIVDVFASISNSHAPDNHMMVYYQNF